MKYLHERRKALGGYLPQRRKKADELHRAGAGHLQGRAGAHGRGREISTTQAFVRFLTHCCATRPRPARVPILVDEARTFGMEGLFRQIGIYNPKGQQYTPVDKDQVMYYKEDKAARSCRKASTRPAAWPAGSPRPPATARTTAS
jgi:pyruvate dehydrogenase E1 component